MVEDGLKPYEAMVYGEIRRYDELALQRERKKRQERVEAAIRNSPEAVTTDLMVMFKGDDVITPEHIARRVRNHFKRKNDNKKYVT